MVGPKRMLSDMDEVLLSAERQMMAESNPESQSWMGNDVKETLSMHPSSWNSSPLRTTATPRSSSGGQMRCQRGGPAVGEDKQKAR